ncbi:hypothetical protein [Comamonas thiooxydans]|uniref:hypothetical protein n=1 Tax=Comamonas thiooxydans TaxID=363952 RepID=UPI000B422A28|nr:hypothetical protein [Comamonas thiooxydans]
MRKVVGLTGLRGSGKDTAAAILVANDWVRVAFADPLYREAAAAFSSTVEHFAIRKTKETPQKALALKHCSDQRFVLVVLKALYCRSIRKAYLCEKTRARPGMARRLKKALSRPLSPRMIMQWWGTEYRRHLDGDAYWREQVESIIKGAPNLNFVVTDVRFPDEANLIKVLGGSIGRVTRPSLLGSDDPSLLHESERAMAAYPADHHFLNEDGDAGLAAFQAAVKRALMG